MATKIVILVGSGGALLFALLCQYAYQHFGLDRSIYKNVAEPLFFLSVSVVSIAIVLFFLKDAVLRLWLNFAKWYLPVTVILIAISPTGEGGFLPPLVTKEAASLWLGILFLIISLLLIAYKSYFLRGK